MSRWLGEGGNGGAFVSFRSPGYSILWWGGLFSFMSVQMQFLLRGLLAWNLTEREGALGLTYLVFGVTMLVVTPLGGVATDRYSKRAILIASQGVIMIAAIGMGVAVITDNARFWMLLVAAVAQGASFGFFGPARMAIASEIVGRAQLGNAISLSLLSMNGTRVFAPAAAGVLAGISQIGIGGTYLIAGGCSLISFIFLLRLPAPAPPVRATAEAGTPARSKQPFGEIVGGVRYVLARPPLRRLVLSSFLVIMFGFNYVSFLPALIHDSYGLGDAWVGIISSASAIGAVLVSLPLAARADSVKAKAAMAVAGLGFGLGVFALGLAGTFWVGFAVVGLVGASTTIYQSLSNTLALAMTDDGHQGRVQSLMQLSFAGFGIAALPLGLLAEQIGLRPTLLIMGSVALAASIAYILAEGGWRALTPPADLGSDSLIDDVDLAGSPAARS